MNISHIAKVFCVSYVVSMITDSKLERKERTQKAVIGTVIDYLIEKYIFKTI